MAVDVLTEILIERPPDIVASFAENPDHASQWYENIKAVAWKSPPPMQVGSLVAFVAHFLGRKLEYTYEIREWLPGQKLVMATADGPFPMETTYTWTAEGSGTRMTLRNRGEPTGFSKLAAPLMTLAMRRANEGDLRKLKEILEGGG